MTKNRNLTMLALLGTLTFSIIALINKEITIFYMLYLFWWQALIELLTKIFTQIKNGGGAVVTFVKSYPTFFILVLYWIFIVILFGIVFSFQNLDLLVLNATVLYFKNIPFVLNLILLIVLAGFNFFTNQNSLDFEVGFFSVRLLILHISIILGTFIHFGLMHFYPDSFKTSIYPYLFSAVPFLLLRSYFDWKMMEDNSNINT